MAMRLSPPRRIVTSNLPMPAHLADTDNPEPEVQVVDADVVQDAEFDGLAYRGTVFTHDKIPCSNIGTDVVPKEIAGHGIILPMGANIRYNDVAPGETIPMHRTQSTDYNIILDGEVHLITPCAPGTGKSPAKTRETICRRGDVILQRGTLHAWENRSDVWVRWIVILLGAEPNIVSVEGEPDKNVQLKGFMGNDYGGDEIWAIV